MRGFGRLPQHRTATIITRMGISEDDSVVMAQREDDEGLPLLDRKSTRLHSSH